MAALLAALAPSPTWVPSATYRLSTMSTATAHVVTWYEPSVIGCPAVTAAASIWSRIACCLPLLPPHDDQFFQKPMVLAMLGGWLSTATFTVPSPDFTVMFAHTVVFALSDEPELVDRPGTNQSPFCDGSPYVALPSP